MKLEEKASHLLIQKQKTLSTAESCTGGLLSHRLTNIPGSSAFFKSGLVTYNNEAKKSLLKIPSDILKKHGAVSSETTEKMAQNIRKIFKTNFGIAISGIAGPDGGNKKKPVGLTYIAISTDIETLCLKCIFEGDRLKIKTQAVNQALNLLIEFL